MKYAADEVGIGDMSDGERRYRERCIEKLGHRFRGDERLLDVGCGDGGVARLLRARVAQVVAVDIHPSEEWADEDGVTFQVADGEDLPFGDAAFDIVHSKDSLHHMQDPGRAAHGYRRVLKPGGSALIIEANRFNPIFYVHMTTMLGHEHFSRGQFHSLVSSVFPKASFGAFEAHYVPGAERVAWLQNAVEDALEHIPAFPVSYNFALAPRET
jgi:ubiquinone/menaquinone biosynthesis C-methylase UbiE